MVSVYLDNIKLSTLPQGIKDFEEEVVRDYDIYGFVVKYPLTLKFIGDGYEYIREKKLAGNYCDRILFKLIFNPSNNGDIARTIVGFIMVSSTEENLTKKEISAVIEDGNLYSVIKQNQKVPFNPKSTKTKNGLPMPACSLVNISMFNPANGVYYANSRKCYDLNEIFSNIIYYLSDGKIEFRSDYLTNNYQANDIYFAMTSGSVLRSHLNEPSFFITLEELMKFVYKKFNLWFYVEFNATTENFVFRLEQDIYSNIASAELDYVKDINETYYQEHMYSSVKIGGKAIADRNAVYQLPDLDGLAFKEEKYFFSGDCNIDAELDLYEDKIIVDTNIIERKLTVGVTEYDDDIFCFQYKNSTLQAIRFNYIGGTAYGYNEDFLNVNVANRFCFIGNASIALGSSTPQENEFEAKMNANMAITTSLSLPLTFDNEIFDTNNNYNPVTYIYTAPALGLYSFEVNTLINISTSGAYLFTSNDLISVTIRINHFDSLSSLKATHTANYLVSGRNLNNFFLNANIKKSVYMVSGDYVKAFIDVVFTPATPTNTLNLIINKDSHFKTIYTVTQGGVVVDGQPLDCKIIRLEFDRPIPLSEWDNIAKFPIGKVVIDNNGKNKTNTWVNRAKCKLITGECEWELITSVKENKLN